MGYNETKEIQSKEGGNLLFIPMYNCEKQIVRVLDQLLKLEGGAARYFRDVIVVNNRSTDGGEQAAVQWVRSHDAGVPIHILRNKQNYGLGGSHKVAFHYAINGGYDKLVVLHGDDQGHVTDALPLIADSGNNDWDVARGSRFMNGSTLSGYSKFRTFGNRVFNVLFTIGTGTRVLDLGSGLNVYKVSALHDRVPDGRAQPADPPLADRGAYWWERFNDTLMFDCYMVMAFAQRKMRVKYFTITWTNDDQVSNVKMVNQATKTLAMLASYMRDNKGFIASEHRDNPPQDGYKADVIYERGM